MIIMNSPIQWCVVSIINKVYSHLIVEKKKCGAFRRVIQQNENRAPN